MSSYGIDEGLSYLSSCEVFPTDDVLMNDTINVIQFGWLNLYNIFFWWFLAFGRSLCGLGCCKNVRDLERLVRLVVLGFGGVQ